MSMLVKQLLLLSPLALSLLLVAKSAYGIESSHSLPKDLPQIDEPILLAQVRKSFTVVYSYGGRDLRIKSSSTGKTYRVTYSSPIEPEVGDIVTIILNGDRWITIINERTGKSSAIDSVYD